MVALPFIPMVFSTPELGMIFVTDSVLETATIETGRRVRTGQASVTLPADLIENGQSIVMSEATCDYDSPADYLLPTVTRFSHTYYLRPRTTDAIVCSNC